MLDKEEIDIDKLRPKTVLKYGLKHMQDKLFKNLDEMIEHYKNNIDKADVYIEPNIKQPNYARELNVYVTDLEIKENYKVNIIDTAVKFNTTITRVYEVIGLESEEQLVDILNICADETNSGYALKSVADKYRLSVKKMEEYLKKFNIQYNKNQGNSRIIDFDFNKEAEMYKTGMNIVDVANELGLSDSWLASNLKRMRLTSNNRENRLIKEEEYKANFRRVISEKLGIVDLMDLKSLLVKDLDAIGLGVGYAKRYENLYECLTSVYGELPFHPWEMYNGATADYWSIKENRGKSYSMVNGRVRVCR